jgi:hypothetical protein
VWCGILCRNTAFKSKDFAKAVDAAKLALELDVENMEASSLLKKAEQALKAERASVGVGDSVADSADVATKPRAAAKPLKSIEGMFDDDDEDDDDMFGE